MINNIVHPGYITSKNDIQYHYIPGYMLIKLYKLNPHETIIDNGSNLKGLDLAKYKHYYPRSDGDYNER